jgi:hypothetical protein
MNIPKIVFKYSSIYDDLFKENYLKEQKGNDEKSDSYPTAEEIEKFIDVLKKKWEPKEKSILEELSKITTLQWKEDKIICYVVGRTIAFSDPLTIPAYTGYEEYAVDVLTHELIHQLFTQKGNYERSYESWRNIHKKYASYSDNTRIHIPLEAVHKALYLNLFDDNRLKRDKDFLSLIPDYKTAWDVVEKEGYQNIIKDFISMFAQGKQ